MDSTSAYQPPQGPQQQGVHNLKDESYTPQMWMDDLERWGASGDANIGSSLGHLFLYPLHSAAANGRTDIALFMLSKGYDKGVLDADGQTPLHLAAKEGYSATARALLDAGADASLRCTQNISALDLAAGLGHVDVVTVLAEYGADVKAAGIGGKTSLHFAAGTGAAETASLLLAKGAAVNAVDDQGSTPLSIAAYKGYVAVTEVLLTAGADIALRDREGVSALDRAAKEGHVDIMRAIIEHGVDVNAGNRRGFTALHTAATYGRAAAIDVLAEAGANIGQRVGQGEVGGNGLTPLLAAADNSHPAAVLALLRHGACVNERNALGRTPIEIAAFRAGTVGAVEVVDLLLRHGAVDTARIRNARKRGTLSSIVGCRVRQQDRLAGDVGRVRKLLVNAPADRAWRRRGLLILCRAHYPSGRVQLAHWRSHTRDTGMAKRTRTCAGPLRAEAEWDGVASMLMGVGADPISLMGDGADIIFETIVGYV